MTKTHILYGEKVTIHWEQLELIEKHDSGHSEYSLRGDGDNGLEYSGTGDFQHGELEDVRDIEEI